MSEFSQAVFRAIKMQNLVQYNISFAFKAQSFSNLCNLYKTHSQYYDIFFH